MENILCICNTYMQLILAVQIKNTIKKDDKVYVVLSDHSKNAEKLVQNLRSLYYFEDVKFIKSSIYDFQNKPVLKGLVNMWKCSYGQISFLGESWDEIIFNELIFYNYNLSTLAIFDQVRRNNNDIRCGRYEEGIVSYESEKNIGNTFFSNRMMIAHNIRKVMKKKNPIDCVLNYYCFYPDFYSGIYTPIRVPLFTKGKCREILSKAFNVDQQMLHYRQKYIFFASVGDFEGGNPVGELEVALNIAKLIGNDNLLIKVHPRDKTDAFLKAGLNIDKNSSVPWEIIQLNHDFSNHVFLTVASSSVFGVNLMLENRAKVYFLYKLCNVKGNSLIMNSVLSVNHILRNMDKIDTSNYYVADKIEDICV